jgi:voltage-gated potassium channel
MKLKNILINTLVVFAALYLGGWINMFLIETGPKVIAPPAGVDMTTEEGLKQGMALMQPQHFLFPYLDLRVLRVLRLLRILKLSNYNTALQDLFQAVKSEKQAFGSALFLLLIATIVAASLMYFAEGHAQPEHFASIPAAIYWAIITITSGYGNVEPMTRAGEIIALLTGFLGVCMAAIMTAIVASAFSNQMSRKKATFMAQLREVLSDGQVSVAESEVLQRMQRQFRLTDDAVANMMNQVKKELGIKD